MAQYVANVHPPESVVDLGDEPAFVSLDIEASPFFYRIGSGEGFSDVREALPERSLRDAKPDTQCRFEFGVTQCRFLQLLAADHMHGTPDTCFAFCEYHSSHIANVSRWGFFKLTRKGKGG